MLKKEQLNKRITFMVGTLFGLILCFIVMSTMSQAVAEETQASALKFPVYFNGKMIAMNEALIKDGRTYVQLRELCEQINVTVDWVDPAYHMAFPPGGGLPEGINLTNPTFVYTNEVTDYYDTAQKINCVEITGLYWKYETWRYETDNNWEYAFGHEGLEIRTNGSEKIIPLKYNPINGRMYLSVDEFREKVQPYLVDMCMQAI